MTQQLIESSLSWIGTHPTWSGILVFLISLSESLAIVGLIIPGVALMTAIGAMMGSGVLPLTSTLIWAMLGAIAGDGISYWIGKHYQEGIRKLWPFKQFPQLLARGQAFFTLHGGKSIVFGRFVGPVRPMIPVIAGMMNMPSNVFLSYNVFSAILWAPLYCLPGIIIGASMGSLSKEATAKIGVIIIVLLLLLWGFYTFVLQFILFLNDKFTKAADKLWRITVKSRKFPWISHALLNPRTGQGQFRSVLFLGLSLSLFVSILGQIVFKNGLYHWNIPVNDLCKALYNEQWVNVALYLTVLGKPKVLYGLVVSMTLWLIYKKQHLNSLIWLSSICLGYSSVHLVKCLIHTNRPSSMSFELSNSFPSLHSFGACLVISLMAMYINQGLEPAKRWITWTIAIAYSLLVGWSRIYLEFHWLSDVLGAYSLAMCFLALTQLVQCRLVKKTLAPYPLIILTILSLGASYTLIYPKSVAKTRGQVVRQWPLGSEFNQVTWFKGQAIQKNLCRNGAFNRRACVFNLQWLGSLQGITKSLEQNAWQVLPKFKWDQVLGSLESKPPLSLSPLPEFHRNRISVLTAVHALPNAEQRLVLKLWQSDMLSAEQEPLWIGYLRIENLKSIVPLIKFYGLDKLANAEALAIANPWLSNANNQIRIIKLSEAVVKEVLLIHSNH